MSYGGNLHSNNHYNNYNLQVTNIMNGAVEVEVMEDMAVVAEVMEGLILWAGMEQWTWAVEDLQQMRKYKHRSLNS
jgi:hypothetical protein